MSVPHVADGRIACVLQSPPLGWGLLKLRSLIYLLRQILIYRNSRLDILNHFHIWQVSPQLSCGDTCQIWTWYFIVNVCFDSAGGNNGTEEIGLVTPTPGWDATTFSMAHPCIMTSSKGNIFHVTGPLWEDSTSHQWIPLTKASDAELWCFLWSAPEQMVEQTIKTHVIWDTIMLIMA